MVEGVTKLDVARQVHLQYTVNEMPIWIFQNHSPCEPKMVLTCVLNPLKSLGVMFWCFMFIHKNIKRVKCGVDLSLDFRSSCVVVLKFYLNRELP